MSTPQCNALVQVETTCGSLLYELQIIWDEVGESDAERDKMLLELEQECLEVYRRKVDHANRSRAQLRQAIADAEAELAAICSAMGERPVHIRQSDHSSGSLKEELKTIIPQLEEMRKRKRDRRKQFQEVLNEIQKVSHELYKSTELLSSSMAIEETDLSSRKLDELHRQLQALEKEKSDRLNQVSEYMHILNSFCLVLGMDFKETVSKVHPSLGDYDGAKNLSNDTIERLMIATKQLREVKIQRMQRLQDLATTLLELWNLMDTPIEEQQMFQNVTCNVAASEHEITEPDTLSDDFIKWVEAEVFRLEALKASKMKELVLKKRSELEEICRKTHLVLDTDSSVEYALEAMDSGTVDATYVLEQIELHISKIKEEAFARKEMLEKVEKWIAACEEESWLEEYNRDENRYNAGRGGHIILKRAEKARALVNKLPAMVEALASKVSAWENERGTEFTYDGIRLLHMLDEYNILRQEKEQERRRQRDQKKIQGQLMAEQEALFGSKPSPAKPQSVKKAPRASTGGATGRRLSLGGYQTHRPDPKAAATHSRPSKKNDRLDDDFSSLSSGSRGLDVAGLPVKHHSFGTANPRDIELPMMRKPFSPIPSNAPSEDNNNTKQCEGFQKTLPISSTTTPISKTSNVVDEENRTPMTMPIPVPTTPKTVSIPMQTAVTPAVVPLALQEIEYSFEERRAGFVLQV